MRWWLMALLAASACSGSDDKDPTEVGDDDDDTTGDDDDTTGDDDDDTGDDDDDTTTELTEDAFGEAFADAYCEAAKYCGSSADLIAAACDEPGTTTTDLKCTFDPVLAQSCLDEGFTCETAAGFAYPLPAEACLDVYDCPDPTTTTTPEQPAEIDAITATCAGTGYPYDGWTVQAEMGPGSVATTAMVMVANTATVPYGALYFEEHPMVLDIGDDWAVDTTPVQALADVVPGQTSLADCVDLSTLSTAVVRLYDEQGTLIDCAGAGHDPQGWFDGDYDAEWFAPIRDAQELVDCRAL